MAETITARWAGPSAPAGDGGATSGSRYRIERSLDWETWTELAAAQAATAPYVSLTATLAAEADYGDTGISLNANSLPTAGFGLLDDAYIQWTGKSGANLTGVTWHSGYGSYAGGSLLTQAHESYTDAGVVPTNLAVVYRITHIDALDRESPPAYLWYFYPSKPASPDHCVVLAAEWSDVGYTPQAGVPIGVYLANDTEFASVAGGHLDSNHLAGNTLTTNALGLAEAQCWKTAARITKGGGAPGGYVFVINKNSGPLNVTVDIVPERDFALLKDLGA